MEVVTQFILIVGVSNSTHKYTFLGFPLFEAKVLHDRAIALADLVGGEVRVDGFRSYGD